ncbi:MAG TPA: chorismate synthase, partial [Thermoanaerobaculia bacterium]|nr:chorismate synthase [Thermoanaerobaculia bacterium]
MHFTTAGESHGPALTIIVQGIPAGLRLDKNAINNDLRRRQHGYGRGGRMKIETDT